MIKIVAGIIFGACMAFLFCGLYIDKVTPEIESHGAEVALIGAIDACERAGVFDFGTALVTCEVEHD